VPDPNFLAEVFPIFLHPSRQMLGEYLKLGHCSILLLPFRFVILYQPVLRLHKTSYWHCCYIKLLTKYFGCSALLGYSTQISFLSFYDKLTHLYSRRIEAMCFSQKELTIIKPYFPHDAVARIVPRPPHYHTQTHHIR